MFGFNLGNILGGGSTSDSDVDDLNSLDIQIAQTRQYQQSKQQQASFSTGYRPELSNKASGNRKMTATATSTSSTTQQRPNAVSHDDISQSLHQRPSEPDDIEEVETTPHVSHQISLTTHSPPLPSHKTKPDPYSYLYDKTDYCVNPYLDDRGNIKEEMDANDQKYLESLRSAKKHYETLDLHAAPASTSTMSSKTNKKLDRSKEEDNTTSNTMETGREEGAIDFQYSSDQSGQAGQKNSGGLFKKSKSSKVKAFFGGYEVDEFKGGLKVNTSFRYQDPKGGERKSNKSDPKTQSPQNSRKSTSHHQNKRKIDFQQLVSSSEAMQGEEEEMLDDMTNVLTRLATNSNTINQQLAQQGHLTVEMDQHMGNQIRMFDKVGKQMDQILAKSNCSHYSIILIEFLLIIVLFFALVII